MKVSVMTNTIMFAIIVVIAMVSICTATAPQQVVCDQFGCRVIPTSRQVAVVGNVDYVPVSIPAITASIVEETPSPVVAEVVCPICGRPMSANSAVATYGSVGTSYSYQPVVSYGSRGTSYTTAYSYGSVGSAYASSYTHPTYYAGQSFSGSARQAAWCNGDRRLANRPGLLGRRWR